MSDEHVRVLAQSQGKRTLEQALNELWQKPAVQGWLATDAPHVVVHVGQRWRSDLIVQTAKSLVNLFARRLPSDRVELLDPAAATNGAPRSHAGAHASARAVTVSGVVAHAVRIPARWFEPFFLVTVTGAGPDSATRMSAVLDAQAEPLLDLNPSVPPASTAYEAHRLFASDLVVACATARYTDPASEACWFASPSDVGVEMALMRASGGDPAQLPYVKMLARHELLPAMEADGIAPSLSGYVAPAWRAEMHAARGRLATSRHAVIQDVIAVRRNLRRIPPALRRRLANWKRGSG